MVLVFGGAYQGKLEYVMVQHQLSEADVFFCEGKAQIDFDKKVIYEIDKWLLEVIKAEADIKANVKAVLEHTQDKIIICNDISSGVVPVDKTLRLWREEVGRMMGQLSKQANEVVRLYVGIPTRLK